MKRFLPSISQLLAVLVMGTLCAGALYITQVRGNPARVVETCAQAANKPLCYSTEIVKVLRARDIPAAFDALAYSYDNDPAFAGTCHDVTHILGEAAYKEFSATGKTELTSKAWYCGYGFYHGFMDALYIDTNDMEVARDFCAYVGKNVPHPPSPELAEGSCYHGIGHGITDGTDPRLWGDALAIVKPSLAVCAKVAPDNDEWRFRCASGVFNSLGNMYPDPKYKLDSGTDPYALCREGSFAPPDKRACYDQMNTQAAELGHDSLKEIIAFGMQIPEERYREAAIGQASAFYIQILKWDQKAFRPEEARLCELGRDILTQTCVRGIISGMIEFGRPNEQYEEILQMCAAPDFPDDLRRTCYSFLQRQASSYYLPAVVSKICVRVPEEYREKDSCGI